MISILFNSLWLFDIVPQDSGSPVEPPIYEGLRVARLRESRDQGWHCQEDVVVSLDQEVEVGRGAEEIAAKC